MLCSLKYTKTSPSKKTTPLLKHITCTFVLLHSLLLPVCLKPYLKYDLMYEFFHSIEPCNDILKDAMLKSLCDNDLKNVSYKCLMSTC